MINSNLKISVLDKNWIIFYVFLTIPKSCKFVGIE